MHTLLFLPDQDQQAVEAFRKRVQQTYPERIEQMILYGSKARDDGHAYSDLDVLLIVDREDWRLRHAISGIAADVSLAYDVLIGPKVIGRQRWDKMRRHRFTLYENVRADGIELLPEEQSETSGLAGEEVSVHVG